MIGRMIERPSGMFVMERPFGPPAEPAKAPQPRDESGRFVAVHCPDLNCEGVLVFVPHPRHPTFECNGLTHEREGDPLESCTRTIFAPLSMRSKEPNK